MQLEFGILCDQVRREDNGKLLFIGVYPADIKVPNFPCDILLTLVVAFTPSHVGNETLDLTMSLNGKKQRTGQAKLNAVSTKKSFGVFPSIPVHLDGPGQLEFLVESAGKSLKAWVGDVVT